ncbi:MAG: FAD-dependent oxidoreductase [Planctomycetaceae bacterium]|nr:FAD-dependent oxidoreductase [Planctomycetaceae bacterium]
MTYDYDILVIGLGPAGMAVSLMGAAMGLKVCAVEKHAVGGECMNVGCIPSKALLRMGKARAAFDKLAEMQLESTPKPAVLHPFGKIADSLKYISDKKTMGMFSKVEMIYQQGAASFVDPQTVEVAGRKITAKRFFVCVGTRPEIPDFPGINEIEPLTNENMFQLEQVPQRLVVLGSGAIACEMAQAFSRLGSSVDLVFRGPGLMWREDNESTKILEEQFVKEGIRLHRNCTPIRFSKTETGISLETDKSGKIETDRVLCALGRRFDFESLKLANAGIVSTKKGITVDKYLRTTNKSVYACGDCNGLHQFSHAAMHQGMLALMNCMIPWPMKYRYDKYVVPWTVFTEPQISRVGLTGKQLDESKIKHRTVTAKYEDYGAAIAESIAVGHVKAHVSPRLGKILGVTIVGEGSGEMINEWALAMQNRLGMYQIMMQQHSFPTMGFLTKRVAETWMMENMESDWLKWICRKMFGF